MTLPHSDSAYDIELSKAAAALVRAGERARELALQTHTAVITWRDGEIVRTYPHLEPLRRGSR